MKTNQTGKCLDQSGQDHDSARITHAPSNWPQYQKVAPVTPLPETQQEGRYSLNDSETATGLETAATLNSSPASTHILCRVHSCSQEFLVPNPGAADNAVTPSGQRDSDGFNRATSKRKKKRAAEEFLLHRPHNS